MNPLERITGLFRARAAAQPVVLKGQLALATRDDAAGRVQPLPSPRAEIKIKVGPDRGWVGAQGSVPPDQAGHLITTFGILGAAGMGATAAVFTVHTSAGVAFAELAVALVAMVLIAACSRARRQRSHGPDAPGGSGRPDHSTPAN
jgi:hypothetical protein